MYSSRTILSHHLTSTIYKTVTRFIRRDPGIGRRLKTIPFESGEAENVDFEDLESDFMDVHKSHKQHMREMELLKEKEKYHIVRQKYFKEDKFPNFLTWHDKEQIKHLHGTQPEEWTIEKLSEGFPALPETIKKIVKANWTKTKQHKIANHDASAQNNWKLFKTGKMRELPPELVEHLKKFTNRALNFKPFEISSEKIEIKKRTPPGEFSEIITSYQKQNQILIEDKEVKNEKLALREDYSFSKSKKSHSVTLAQLQNQIRSKAESGKNINDEEKLMIMNARDDKKNSEVQATNLDSSEIVDLSKNKYQGTSSVSNLVKKSYKDLSHLDYPEKILIPKKIHRRGKLYKLNDCYYDDDGEFLYRVPGMC